MLKIKHFSSWIERYLDIVKAIIYVFPSIYRYAHSNHQYKPYNIKEYNRHNQLQNE